MPSPASWQWLEEAVRTAYLEACELELLSLKPGNVHVHADGHGLTVEDFRRSAALSAAPMSAAGLTLGERVYGAVRASREEVGTNTNLGIVLLCAPMAQAVWDATDPRSWRRQLPATLRAGTVADTAAVFDAIRLAAPGGLGRSAEHDVHAEARAPLLRVMTVSAQRDRIARQYARGFDDVLQRGALRFAQLRSRWSSGAWAASAVFLEMLARYPDTHIERKFGSALACSVSAKVTRVACALMESGAPEGFARELMELDRDLKRAGLNPGTTADLTVASLFAVFLDDRLGAVPAECFAPVDRAHRADGISKFN